MQNITYSVLFIRRHLCVTLKMIFIYARNIKPYSLYANELAVSSRLIFCLFSGNIMRESLFRVLFIIFNECENALQMITLPPTQKSQHLRFGLRGFFGRKAGNSMLEHFAIKNLHK